MWTLWYGVWNFIISFRIYAGSALWVVLIIFILIKRAYYSQVGVLNGKVIHRPHMLAWERHGPRSSPTPFPSPFQRPYTGWVLGGCCAHSPGLWLGFYRREKMLTSRTLLRKVKKKNVGKKLPSLAQTSCSSKVPVYSQLWIKNKIHHCYYSHSTWKKRSGSQEIFIRW